jgi:hypothetical protein
VKLTRYVMDMECECFCESEAELLECGGSGVRTEYEWL